MKKKSGFTLAEVLITLAIIGVVAAITLPTLNSNTGAVRNRALLKKGMTTLSNAAKMNQANEGWNFSGIDSETNCDTAGGMALRANNSTTMCGLLNSTLSAETFLGVLNTGDPTPTEYSIIGGLNDSAGSAAWFINYQLSDGIIIGLNRHAQGCTEDMRTNDASAMGNSLTACGGYIDVNGAQGPNNIISCESGEETKYIWDNDYDTCEINPNTNADIFPIVFYDGNVELSSNAGKAFFNAR